MGESQCPVCHHIVTGFEKETFEAGLSILKAKDDEIARLRHALTDIIGVGGDVATMLNIAAAVLRK